MKPHERILVALDTPDENRALALAGDLAGHVGGVKVGFELFTAAGPTIVRRLADSGLEVFLDLKLHDIPNTVAGAARVAARLGVAFLTVHALGGSEMIRRGSRSAAESAAEAGVTPPILLAVTILTSHDESDLRSLGIAGTGGEAVARLATLAREAGAGGIVCSPLEIRQVREVFPEATIVVPGIRPASRTAGRDDDQARTATPAEAVRSGADRIVIGRPITSAADPVAAAEGIAVEIGG